MGEQLQQSAPQRLRHYNTVGFLRILAAEKHHLPFKLKKKKVWEKEGCSCSRIVGAGTGSESPSRLAHWHSRLPLSLAGWPSSEREVLRRLKLPYTQGPLWHWALERQRHRAALPDSTLLLGPVPHLPTTVRRNVGTGAQRGSAAGDRNPPAFLQIHRSSRAQ